MEGGELKQTEVLRKKVARRKLPRKLAAHLSRGAPSLGRIGRVLPHSRPLEIVSMIVITVCHLLIATKKRCVK